MTAGIYFKTKCIFFFFFAVLIVLVIILIIIIALVVAGVHHLQEERKVRQMNSIYGTMMADRGTKSWHLL